MKQRMVEEDPDPREKLERAAHRQVRYVAARSSPESEALFDVVKERITDRPWTVEEWDAACDELDRCTLTIREWLALEDHNRKSKDEPAKV